MQKLKVAIVWSLLGLIALTAGMAYAIYPHAETEKDYREIISFSKLEREDITTYQERKDVSKHFIKGGKENREMLAVNCESSTLYLKPSLGLGETVEEMSKVTAELKRNEDDPAQYKLNAEKAVFYPKLKHLTLEKVSANQEQMKTTAGGIEVVDSGTAIFDGELLHLSDKMHAVLKNMDITAEKATFYPRKNVKQIEIEKIYLSGNVNVKSKQGQSPMDLKAAQLNWDLNTKILQASGTPGSLVHCEDSTTRVVGNQLEAKLVDVNGSLQPERLIMKGNVKLQTLNSINPQYALADVLEYTPKNRTWILSATAPNRVLYYDKVNSVTISAPRVIVQQMEGQQKPHVKATGDVRFMFGDKEINELQQKFQTFKTK